MRADHLFSEGRRDPAVIIASFGANLLSLAIPMSMIHIYDRVIPNQSFETLAALGIMVIGAILAELLLRGARRHLLEMSAEEFEEKAYTSAIRALLTADPATLKKASHGSYYRGISGIETLRNMHVGNAALDPLDLPFALLFLGVIALISPVLGATVFSLLALAFLTLRRVRSVVQKHQIRRKDNEERRHSYLAEVLRGTEVIKNMRIEDFMIRRYERLMGNAASISADTAYSVQLAQGITAAIGMLSPLFVGSIGAILVIQGQMTVGSLAAIILLTGRIIQPVLRVEAYLAGAENLRQYEKDLHDILSLPTRVEGPQALDAVESLDLQSVSFAPDPSLRIGFDKLDLTLKRGDCLVVTGATRQARRAFLRGLMGELQKTEGDIRLNGQPISEFDLGDRLRLIKLLSPENALMEGTLLDNLTAFQPRLYRDTAVELSQRIGIEQTISQSAEGFALKVGPDSRAGLPRSLTDAITIVGSLVQSPDIILFDEANGALDRETDAKLLEILREHRDDCIIVMVSNRPSYTNLATRSIDLSAHVVEARLEEAA